MAPLSSPQRRGRAVPPEWGCWAAGLEGTSADSPYALGLPALPGSQAAHKASGRIPPCFLGPIAPTCPSWLRSLQLQHTGQEEGKACSSPETQAPLLQASACC